MSCHPCSCPSWPRGSHAGNEAVVCAGLFWGWRLFQEASERPAHQHCCRWTLRGSTWLTELMCLGCLTAKSFGGKRTWSFFFFLLSSCHCSSPCIAWRHLCFTQQEMDVGKGASLGVAQQERGVLPTQGT